MLDVNPETLSLCFPGPRSHRAVSVFQILQEAGWPSLNTYPLWLQDTPPSSTRFPSSVYTCPESTLLSAASALISDLWGLFGSCYLLYSLPSSGKLL